MLDTRGEAPKNKASGRANLERADLGDIIGAPQASSGMFHPRNWIWALSALAILVGLYAYWSLKGEGSSVRYTTAPIARGDLTVLVTATGSAQPITQVNISSELSGTVRHVRVDYNSPVRAGDVLAELDTEKLKATTEISRAKLESARAKVTEASATVEEKRAEYERKKSLSARDVGSVRDLDVAKAAYERALAQNAMAIADVGIAEADLQLTQINLGKACICSPVNGVVLKRSVDPGQIVASSLQAPVLFVIAEDLRHMELQVDVDEADVGKVKIGQQVTFSVDAYPERKFPAEVRDVRFGSETVQGVVTYKAVLTIDNSELLIRPGMTATAQIVVQKISDALMVPNAALRFSPPAAKREGPGLLRVLLPQPPSALRRPASKAVETGATRTVWMLDHGVARAVPVRIGATDGRQTEILTGDISQGQSVIVDASIAK